MKFDQARVPRNRALLSMLLLAGIVLLLVFARAKNAPVLSDDSYQYIGAANSLVSGECLCTHLAHFYEQLAWGRMPVPLTHFPPGYSLLLAATSYTHLSMPNAGLLLSAIGFLLTLCFIWDIAFGLRAKPWAVVALSALWLTSSLALGDALRVGTEALFTAAVAGLAAMIVRDIRRHGERPRLLFFIGLTAGAAYDLRYAGIFLLPVIALYLFWRWRRTPGALPWALSGIAAMALMAGSVMLRNIHYTGSWRGGFDSGALGSVRELLIGTFKAYYHLVFGEAAKTRPDAWWVVFVISAAAVVVLVHLAWRNGVFRQLSVPERHCYIWLPAMIVVYSGGIMLTALLTIAGNMAIAANMTRYERPVYPVILALAAPLLSLALRQRLILVGIAAVAATIGIHSRSLAAPQPLPPHVVAGELLNGDVQPGVTAETWLLQHVSPRDILLAPNAQAVSYILNRDVISANPASGSHPSDEAAYHALMLKDHIRYLLLIPGIQESDTDGEYGAPFLRDLATSRSPVSWLHQAARNTNLTVYECETCAK